GIVGSGSAITCLTNAPTRAAAVDLLSGYPVVAPGLGDSVRVGVAVEFNGPVNDPVQPWRRLSFFPDTPKLCRGRRVAMSNRLREFLVCPTANLGSVRCVRGLASPRRAGVRS